MSTKLQLKRTEGTDPPTELAFGELAFADGSDTVFVGKKNGTKLPLGSSTPSGLADVAYTGSYDDLTDKPTIPVLPPLADVAYTGSYDDLTDKPIIPVVPPLADVAYTGSYDDLTDKPTILTTSFDLIPLPGTEATTNKLFHNGTGYRTVYRRRITVATPYPNGGYVIRTHGIANIEHVVDYALFYRGSGYLYKVTYGEIPSGITETALFGLSDYIWGSAKNKNTDGSAADGAWWEVEYTKSTDGYVTV